MKFVIRKVIEQEWKNDDQEHNVSHCEDKIYLNPYTYKEAMRKISAIYSDIEYYYDRLNNFEDTTICKWDIRIMLIPVTENFKGQTNWINTKNFLKYKG
jgi:hypothetical protein